MGTERLVQAEAIKEATLHRRLPLLQHAYAWPFAAVWAGWLYVYTQRYDVLGSQEFTALSLLLVGMVQALVFLACQWSVSVQALLTCQRADDPFNAEVVRVIAAGLGKSAMCPVDFGLNVRDEARPQVSFTFQAQKYIYDEDKRQFTAVSYPADACPQLSELQQARGLSTAEVAEAQAVFGRNRFDVPVPTFGELFKEHAVAPFFVFQLFCVGLWCLDEYWYYSIFSLVMLVVFESTLVFQRLRTLTEFRSLSMQPYRMQALRGGAWTEVSTEDLCPGDVVSVVRTGEDSGVPCDVLLVGGSCIVNEAMLSGESTPQLKEAVARDAALDMDGEDRGSMLFGGTKVLQAEPAAGELTTPDGGCACVVLRTGFGTAQGELVRTMLHSSERVSADNKESYLFIGFLLVFAIAAATYVWREGRGGTRPQSKVLLDCVLIVTSVVPPELPMELSMAVNSSLMALAKLAIFCTEPFRIPHAGRVDICCFDKTGTLTGEDLVVEGVADAGDSELRSARNVSRDAALTLAGAHALVMLDGGDVVGDPMERAQLDAAGFRVAAGEVIEPAADRELSVSLAVRRRFAFSSALKRSATLAEVHGVKGRRYFVAAKGAPETMRARLHAVPAGYDDTFRAFSRRGGRVLALASKWLPERTLSEADVADLARDSIEADLEFQGFLVFSCPLKPDSAAAVRALSEASHRCVMITGDNPLTAAHVAREVGIVDRGVLVLDGDNGSDEVTCASIDGETRFVVALDDTPRMERALDGWDVCVTGAALERL
ncbi:putative cation-transporting ATPase 1, partial [Coemansia sp. RSA 2706]